jgi:hypothetical protein
MAAAPQLWLATLVSVVSLREPVVLRRALVAPLPERAVQRRALVALLPERAVLLRALVVQQAACATLAGARLAQMRGRCPIRAVARPTAAAERWVGAMVRSRSFPRSLARALNSRPAPTQ